MSELPYTFLSFSFDVTFLICAKHLLKLLILFSLFSDLICLCELHLPRREPLNTKGTHKRLAEGIMVYSEIFNRNILECEVWGLFAFRKGDLVQRCLAVAITRGFALCCIASFSTRTAVFDCYYVAHYCLVILWQRPDVECFLLLSALKPL